MKLVLLLSSVVTAAAACGGSFKATGSDTVEPIALAWKGGYTKNCPSAKITISAGGSTVGASDVCTGLSDIGMMSRAFKSTEATGSNGKYTCVKGGRKITQVSVALDGITLVAKIGGPAAKCIKALGGLTTAQLKIIFSSAKSAPKWNVLGSQCASITSAIKITGPDSTAGTYSFFTGVVFPNGEKFRPSYFNTDSADYNKVIKTIESDGNYIGYIPYGYYVKNKSALYAAPIKNSSGKYKLPSATSIGDGSYNPFTRSLYMSLNAATVATKTKAYLDYGYSTAGQTLVTNAGFVALPASTISTMKGRIGG